LIAVLHLLALTRGLAQGRAALAAGRLGEPMGVGLDQRAVAILGMGQIGREVEARLRGFGARVVGIGRGDDLLGALADVDDLIVCLPLTDETRGIVGGAELRALGPGFVVNVGRGPLVDYDALLAALRDGTTRGAGLD